MPRIPDEEIDRIKRGTDLAALVRSRGVELHKHGSRDLVGKCPFHPDREPSFVVSPAKGLFHCLGCGAAGNAIQFVEKFDGVSFRHAFELLAAGTPAFSARSSVPLKQSTVPRLEAPLDPAADEGPLLLQVVDFYHERLLATPAALDYLAGRGLRHEEAIERFRLGFADRTLGLRLPEANRKDGAAIRKRLQDLGILRESGHEHFNGCAVLPVFTDTGAVGEMYGRRIVRPSAGAPKHLYLPGPHRGIWNADALTEPELILCEAPFDALTFWVNGFRNVTFIYGTQGFTEELFAALVSHRVRRVRLAYDADEAGDTAAARDLERLTAQGIECFRVRFPRGMDANEFAQKVQPPGKALQGLLAAAEWCGGTVNAGKIPPSPAPPETPADAPAPAPSSLPLAALPEAALPAAERRKEDSAVKEENRSGPECAGLERVGEYQVLRLGEREYRVGGLEKNNSLEAMKVAVRLRCGENFHLDSFDLAQDSQRRRYIERAAEETGLEKELIKRDLGRLLLALEQAQSARLNAALTPDTRRPAPEMTGAERAEALALLQAPDLVEKIGAAFDTCGLAGEAANRLAAYLACTSRLLDKPLAVIIQSTSAAGKSTLMEAVLSMFPEEQRVKYSAMTGQSLYYLGGTDLKHRILAIVEEEGAEKACYALKLLQSEGELTIASTGKDPKTGRMETQEYHVEGPVMIFLTTTAVDIDEELQNRCLTLTVDESREQTERIHTLQRQARTLDGLRRRRERDRLLTLLRNAQRLLKPMDVVNPWADALTFTAERTRTRRDHEKYLTLIDAIALLHQYQRPVHALPVAEAGAPCPCTPGKGTRPSALPMHHRAGPAAPSLPPARRDDGCRSADASRSGGTHPPKEMPAGCPVPRPGAPAPQAGHPAFDAAAAAASKAVLRGVRGVNDAPAGVQGAAPLARGPGTASPPSGYIEVTLDDITLANRLAPELLGRSLDELPPQTRHVYETVKALVREKCDAVQAAQRFAFFSRCEIRKRLGWSATQVRFHLERLRELEYIAARYGRPGSAFQYELLTDCREPRQTAVIGLLDVEKLSVRHPTCRENPPPDGGCREPARQVQDVAETALAVNLSA